MNIINGYSMDDNLKAFDDGIAKMNTVIHELFISSIAGYCASLFATAEMLKEYGDMTGNTITSYSCGIYHDGSLVDILLSQDYKKPPVRVKLRLGEVFPKGSIRWGGGIQKYDFKADVDTDRGYGAPFAINFLRQYKPAISKGYSVVICTGTEYSEHLERVHHLDVLTNTSLRAGGLFLQNLRKIG